MKHINRRRFIKKSLLTATSVGVTAGMPVSSWNQEISPVLRPVNTPNDIVDTNVNLSRWPFRRVRGDRTPELVDLLRSHGVTQAWAGSYDGLLHKDIGAVNARLAAACHEYGAGQLVPFGTINPRLPDWEEDLRRCDEEYEMPGVRLHPGYHQYTLEDPLFGELLQRAAERGLIVQLAVLMEDQRMQHPLMQVPVVDLKPLPALLEDLPALRLVIQNNRSNVPGELLHRLAATGQVYVDMARTEGMGAVSNLLETVPANRVLFGSHAPLFYHKAALLKMKAAGLTKAHADAIYRENARQLIGKKWS